MESAQGMSVQDRGFTPLFPRATPRRLTMPA